MATRAVLAQGSDQRLALPVDETGRVGTARQTLVGKPKAGAPPAKVGVALETAVAKPNIANAALDSGLTCPQRQHTHTSTHTETHTHTHKHTHRNTHTHIPSYTRAHHLTHAGSRVDPAQAAASAASGAT